MSKVIDTKFSVTKSFSKEVDIKNIVSELKKVIMDRSMRCSVTEKEDGLSAKGKLKGSQLIAYEVDVKITNNGLVLDCELYKDGLVGMVILFIIMGILFFPLFLLLIIPAVRLPKNRTDTRNSMNEIVERVLIL